jgi:hypothetical protein
MLFNFGAVLIVFQTVIMRPLIARYDIAKFVTVFVGFLGGFNASFVV